MTRTLLKVYEKVRLSPAEEAAIVDARRILGDLADAAETPGG